MFDYDPPFRDMDRSTIDLAVLSLSNPNVYRGTEESSVKADQLMNDSMAEATTPVLIIGCGPVGMTLALDLAWRGIDSTIVETRAPGEPAGVKCNHVAARTMEVFRRLGVAETVRSAGLPADHPHDVAYRTTTSGRELARIRIPSRRDRDVVSGGPDWPTPEPPHRVNQTYMEPILFEAIAANERITVFNRTRMEGFTQDSDGVTAIVRDLVSDETRTIGAGYLIGCDGGSSVTRQTIGATFHGDPVVQQVQSTFILAPALSGELQHDRAWGTFSFNTRRCGMVYAIDGEQRWLIHNYLLPGETFESVDRDASIRAILGVGDDFTYEVLGNEDWTGRRLLADTFRDGRVFLCGDSAHIWVPFAGYGMNAGIADAADLAWQLAGTIDGWGGPTLLDAYERERLPITEQVSFFAMNHARSVAAQRLTVPDTLEDDGPLADRVRAEWGKAAYDLNIDQYWARGLNFGYFYDQSPIISYDGAKAPDYTMSTFSPSTVPGCRVPHVWLDDGRSLLDALGHDYTLLVLSDGAGTEAIEDAATREGVPLTVLAVHSAQAQAAFDCALLICRPDTHIAWRGDEQPDDPDALWQLLSGRRSAVLY